MRFGKKNVLVQQLFAKLCSFKKRKKKKDESFASLFIFYRLKTVCMFIHFMNVFKF